MCEIPVVDLPKCATDPDLPLLTTFDIYFGYDAPHSANSLPTWEPLGSWKDQPLASLRIFAPQIPDVAASCAPVERVFSMTRTSMSPDLLSAWARAKYNGVDESAD